MSYKDVIKEVQAKLGRKLNNFERISIKLYLEWLEYVGGGAEYEQFTDDSLVYPEDAARLIGGGYREAEFIQTARKFLTKRGTPE